MKPEFFAIKAIQPGHASDVDNEQLLERIKKALEDDSMTKDYKALLNRGPREFGQALPAWHYVPGLLLRRGQG